MFEKRASKRFTVLFFILSALMMLLIWSQSCLPADLSAEESAGVMYLLSRFFSLFGWGEVLTQHTLRKIAHYSEFAVLGGLLTSCAYSFDRLKPCRFAVPVLFTGLLTAFIDETIQLFVKGRAGMIADVWIDFGGMTSGALVMLAFYTVYRRRKQKKEKDTREGV